VNFLLSVVTPKQLPYSCFAMMMVDADKLELTYCHHVTYDMPDLMTG